MKIFIKKSLLIIIPLAILSAVLLLSFTNPNAVTLESKFGTFCLNCKVYESVSGNNTYGFGVASCDGSIKEMSNKVNYDEINKFKLHLEDNGFTKILNLVTKIEQHLKSNNSEKYIFTVEEYIKEIELLDEMEKEKALSFFAKD